jgi:hypothetical protein
LTSTDTTSSPQLYTTRIIKASALLEDTRTLFAHWDSSRPTRENLERIRSQNLFGKASRARVEDVLRIFQQRYLRDPEVANALATLVQGGFPSRTLNWIFYFHATQSDRLLHDAVTEILAPLYRRGSSEISSPSVFAQLRDWVYEGKTTSRWSEPTIRRVAEGLLATLRDFGVLEGSANKRLATPVLPIEAFVYVAFLLQQRERSGDRLVNSPEWQLFFFSPEAVERSFIEAHQYRLLEYYAAGRVVRIEFPASSLQEYARALLERAH